MHGLVSVVLCSALLVSNVDTAPPDTSRDGGLRIRTQDSRTTLSLRDGLARSETLRALVDRIEASNVFVFHSSFPEKSYLVSSMEREVMMLSCASTATWLE